MLRYNTAEYLPGITLEFPSLPMKLNGDAVSSNCRNRIFGKFSLRLGCAIFSASILLLLSASMLPAVAALIPSPCESLAPDRLHFEEVASPTCLRGADQGAPLYSRTEKGESSKEGVIEIQIPFPFRWFGTLYDSIFVGANSYVTFGGTKAVFFDFNALNPPFPSLLIGARDGSMQLLTAQQVPDGLLVRYEGYHDEYADDDGSGQFLASNVIWELLFLRAGGLQLCTGQLFLEFDLTPISGVSHQMSADFAQTFNVQADFLYTFTTTCAASNRALLDAPISSVSGTRLTILMFLSVSAVNVSTWTVTLHGAGFSCLPNSSVSLASSPPSLFSVGMANIMASSTNSPVLVMTGITGTINGSVMLSFTVSGVSTPHQPQEARSGLGFAVHDGSNTLVASGSDFQLEAITIPVALGQTPSLKLSSLIVMSPVTMTVVVSPSSIIFRKTEPRALVITVTGAGWNFDNASVVVNARLASGSDEVDPSWSFTSSSIQSLDAATYRIRINFNRSVNHISSVTPLVITMTPVTTPDTTQSSRSDIKCGVLNAQDSVIAAGSSGTLAAIVSSIGLKALAISFSPPVKSIQNAVLLVKMTPTFEGGKDGKPYTFLNATASQPVEVSFTLSGNGISCPSDSPVSFLLPFVGASGVANIDTKVAMLPVLRVTIRSGYFLSGLPIWFQIGSVSTPFVEQPDMSNISATIVYMTNIVALSSSGTMNSITGGMGTNMPAMQHSVDNGIGRIVLSFAAGTHLPAGSRIIVTLSGIGFKMGESASVAYASRGVSAAGTASIINEPVGSVLVVSIPEVILPGPNVTSFAVSPVLGSFASNLTVGSVCAAVLDSRGNILAASSSGSFVASQTVALSVKDHISSAVNGNIILPTGVFAGNANCNNVIDETMPPRNPGTRVILTGSGSGTVIDCSSTTMRCLVVYRSSITISRITFRGGSSARYVSSSTVKTIRLLYDTTSDAAPQPQHFKTTEASSASFFESAAARSAHAPHASKSHRQSRAASAAGERRRLLQSSSFVQQMFNPDSVECGGCLFVDAVGQNASLFDVTFSNCHAAYGGGAFLNVMAFDAAGGVASNNVARQGGGIFVMSSTGSSIHSFRFVNNTVATFSPSTYEISPESFIGKFPVLPDPNAAAGGGAWFQLLNSAQNCTFSDNTALSAGTSDSAWVSNPNQAFTRGQMAGAHALGSGMFVLETRSFTSNIEIKRAALANVVFQRSQQLCAGWCVAGGALFIGFVEGGTRMSDFIFEGALSAAVASESALPFCSLSCVGPAVALGSCAVIVDLSPQSMIKDVRAEFISSRAVGSIYGGCMTFLQSFLNSAATNISVQRASLISAGSTRNSIRGLFAANAVVNSSISRFFIEKVTLKRAGIPDPGVAYDTAGIFGGVIFVSSSAGMLLSDIHTRELASQSSSFIDGGVIALLNARDSSISHTSAISCSFVVVPSVNSSANHIRGGIFYLETISNVSVFNTSTVNNQLLCLSTAATRIVIAGGVLHTYSATNVTFSESLTINLTMHCEGVACEVLGGSVLSHVCSNMLVSYINISRSQISCSGISCSARGVFLNFNYATNSKIFGITSANVSLSCSGQACNCLGGLVYVKSFMQAPSAPSTSIDCGYCLYLNAVSDIQSSGLSLDCLGQDCYVLGGIAYLEKMFCLALSNIQAYESSISSQGTNSRAAGAIVGIVASSCSRLSGIRSPSSNVFSDGSGSQALGGVLSFLSGNVLVERCIFTRSTVQCSGYRCSAMGGFLSAVSNLIENPKFKNYVVVTSSSFSFGTAACSGYGCTAIGGAVATGTSHRASEWLDVSDPRLSPYRPPPMQLSISGCSFFNNSVSSISAAASAKGGAVSFESSKATVFNCTFSQNFIVSGNSTAFAGGGAIYISQANCSVSVQDCAFFSNDASRKGQGGAILVSVRASFVSTNSTINRNCADKGGGILVDAAEAVISNSVIQNNSAWSGGGGLFCSSNQDSDFFATRGLATKGDSSINLRNVTLSNNLVSDPLALGLGAELFIVGAVLFSADNATKILMKGDSDRDVTAAVVSVATDSSNISMQLACLSGTMLRKAPTSVSNLLSLPRPPTENSMLASKCFPACSEVPAYESYTALSGFLASCTPCPRGTYSFGVSTDVRDTVAAYCRQCPFGAVCNGGDSITSQALHWGWKVSEFTASSEFVNLKSGYGCTKCTAIGSCAGHRDGILCGGCEYGYSLALFQTECVPSSQCESSKAALVIFMCIFYQLFVSLFLFWSVESELLAKRFQLIIEKETALRNIPLFEHLETDQLRSASANLIEESFAPGETVLTQGHAGDGMFVIREGTFDVFIKPVEGMERKVAELQSPQYFGEVSFLDKSACMATVRAATQCKVWKLDRSCIVDVDDATVSSFLSEQRKHYSSGNQKFLKAPPPKVSLYESFDVLIWFYQLAGIMLTMSSPLEYFDGSSVAYSIVSFILNTRPATDSVSTLQSAALNLEALSNRFAFCFFKDTNGVHLHVAALLYYVCWALIITILSMGSFWLHSRRAIVVMFKSLLRPAIKLERVRVYVSFLNERLASSFDLQGAVLLRFCVTCFSATTILMLQGTQCIRLQGINAAGGALRWLYDGRVACFSNEGEISGTWQIGSAIGVAAALLLPVILMFTMMRIKATDADDRSELHSLLFTAYSGPYIEEASHWTVVMFYERVVLIFFITYLTEFPFWQGYAVFCWCLVILLLHFTYRPYKSTFRHLLASICVISLMALCALLLRTQSLLSASRSANFDPMDPSRTLFDSRSPDLEGVIVLTLICLIFPVVFTLYLYIFLNNSALQQIWGAVKARLARIQLVAPRKRTSLPKPDSWESPREMRELRSEISVSRSVSIIMPYESPLQSTMPSSFYSPLSHSHLPFAASKPILPSGNKGVLNAEVAPCGTAVFSSPEASHDRAAEAAAVSKMPPFQKLRPESSAGASNAKQRAASGKSVMQGHPYALA